MIAQYVVTVPKLNKRHQMAAQLPDPFNIAGIIRKGALIEAEPVPAVKTGDQLQSWYRDKDGFYYWGGGIALANAGLPRLSIDRVIAASGAHSTIASKFFPFLSNILDQYAITTSVRQLCFFAQTGHESAGLYYTEELDSGLAYEGRQDLGNTHANDGVRYKGRGLIQITGRNNYQWLSNSFKVDFINSPEKLGGKNASQSSSEQLNYSARSAAWFWQNNQLNAISDKIDIFQAIDEGNNLEEFKRLTRKINGGYNGLNDRIARFKAGLVLFS